MRQFGLVGSVLEHSFSPAFFRQYFENHTIFDAVYEAYPLAEPSLLEDFLLSAHQSLKGLNVTVPYKEAVLPFVKELDPVAKAIGAVNVLKRTQEGHWMGYNTDGPALLDSLGKWLSNAFPECALVLGSGGASKAAVWALHTLGIQPIIVSRSPTSGMICYEELTEHLVHTTHLILQTTPVGTFPHQEQMVHFPVHWLDSRHFLYDFIYNPSVTRLMHEASIRGAKVKNGQEMLENQALRSWFIWNS